MRPRVSTSGGPPAVRFRWRHAVVGAVVLLGGIAATLAMATHEQRSLTAADQRSFEVGTAHVTGQMRLHLSRYEDLLTNFQGLHEDDGSHWKEHFGATAEARVADRRYPGYEGLVVVEATPGGGADLSQVQVQPRWHTAGDFGVTRANEFAITDAMRQATDTGQPAMSRALPVHTANTQRLNLTLWAPLYRGGGVPVSVTQRRVEILGWVGVSVRADQFFNDSLVRSTQGVATEVLDGPAGLEHQIAVRPRDFKPSPGALSRLKNIDAAGRLWTLRMHPLPEALSPRTSVDVILEAGLLLSLAFALFITSLGRAKYRALRLAEIKTVDLRRSEERFRSLAGASPLGVFGLAADGRCEYANERLCELTGRSAAELHGDGLAEAYHADDREALRKAVRGDNDRAAALRLRVLLPDGSVRWVKTHAAPLRDDDGVLTGWVGSVEDVTAEVQAQIASQRLADELEHQARHDDLTGLPNRNFFTQQVATLVSGTDATGVAVLFFDVDRFKVINDSLGHGAGDRFLVTFSERLLAALRPGDVAARFGGDEFVVGLVGVTDAAQAADEAQRLITALNTTMSVGQHEVMVSVSIGVAVADGVCDAETLVMRADAAMYTAKARGKARFEMFSEAPTTARESTLDRQAQLQAAIERDQLRLLYQPLVTLADRTIAGVEALVRWEHPDHGLIAPGDFIPLAEDSGLIVPLGQWVLRTACGQLQQWRRSEVVGPEFSMTINVSARQLADPSFPRTVAAAMHEFDVAPGSLCLEITESAILQDLDTAEAALHALRDLGVRVAVDDFGTGYSSLNHLRLLPVDMLKIDRSFVHDLGVDPDTTAIVGAVIRLAAALGLTAVAEGVEEHDQLVWLGSMGCDMAQGFLLARPQPPDAVGILLRAGLPDDVGQVQAVTAPVSPTAS